MLAGWHDFLKQKDSLPQGEMSNNKQHLRLKDGPLEVRDQDMFHQPSLLDEETVLSEETCLVSDSLKRIGNNQMYSMAKIIYIVKQGFPGGAGGKDSACQCRLGIKDTSWIPGLGRSPGGGNGNPLQYSCLENPMDRGAWRAIAHRVTKSQTQLKQLHTEHC